MKESGDSVRKLFDHHAFYVGYAFTNAFYSAIKTEKGSGDFLQ